MKILEVKDLCKNYGKGSTFHSLMYYHTRLIDNGFGSR